MRKRLLAIALCMATTLTMFGCGSDKQNTESTEVASVETPSLRSGQMDIKAADNVSNLGDYKGIEVTLSKDYSVSEDAVNEQIYSVLQNFDLLYSEVTDRDTVQAGDYVKIDYVGYDSTGEAFQGGTSQSSVIMDIDNNYDVTNQSNYIDGFCSKLEGAKVGEVVKTPVTFPESYSNSDLAGQDASFDITVVGIYKKNAISDITDEQVAANFSDYEITTNQQLVDYMREYLTYSAENDRYTEIVESCEGRLLSETEVTVPEDYLAARLNEYVENFKDQYLTDTQTLDDYFATYGYDTDTIKEQWKSSLEQQIKLEFLFLVIAEKEGLTIDEEGYQEFIQSYLESTSYDFETEEDIYKSFGNGYADEGKEYAQNLYLIRQAIKLVADSAVVTDYVPTEESTEGTETTEE